MATKALPSVQRIKSSAVASEREVGLERGKISGRSALRAMARTMDSVNAPWTVDKPMSTPGFVWLITSAKPVWTCPVLGQCPTRSAGCA